VQPGRSSRHRRAGGTLQLEQPERRQQEMRPRRFGTRSIAARPENHDANSLSRWTRAHELPLTDVEEYKMRVYELNGARGLDSIALNYRADSDFFG